MLLTAATPVSSDIAPAREPARCFNGSGTSGLNIMSFNFGSAPKCPPRPTFISVNSDLPKFFVTRTSAVAGGVVAALVGLLCVRYVKIYFGMLTLAFGMVFYTFLLKFYRLTGGDEGMRVLRPLLLGQEFADLGKTAYLAGPYYYYSLAILAVAAFAMWRIVRSPFGLCLRTIRDNPLKAEALGVSVTRYRWYAFVISGVYGAVGGALLGPPTGNVDPTLAYWTHSGNVVFMTLLGGFSREFGGEGQLLQAFQATYLCVGLLSMLAAAIFLQLDPADGRRARRLEVSAED